VNVRSLVTASTTRVLGTRAVAAAADRRWSGSLRIVAYHQVPDTGAFAAQVDLIRRRYVPVSEDVVREALAGGRALPERAVWVTFDDGDRSVIDTALPVLRAAGVPATLYVCPGLVETATPPWWELVLAAAAEGAGAEVAGRYLTGPALVTALKQRPDGERRAAVDELADAGRRHLDPDRRPVSGVDLTRWLEAGYQVGNHTWDHPCLDRCSEDEQRHQLETAHAWLMAFGAGDRPTFAYPNGDHTDVAEAVLEDLGYDVALLFDHRRADLARGGLRLSRLRLDAGASVPRARAILSGAHSAAFSART
jgi:peptidoglycan/xylan/chitin deacetylase (PgdA/CDA1 family)